MTITENFRNLKANFPKGVLLVKSGDFFESLDKDAMLVSRVCQVSLIRKNIDGHEHFLAGIPYRAISAAYAQLQAAGHDVYFGTQA